MSKIQWKLAEYLKSRGATAEQLAAQLDDPALAEIVYRLVDNPASQCHIDLLALAAIMEALILVTDFPVTIGEILEFVPQLPEEFVEKSPWRDIFLGEDLDPYYPEDIDPTTLGKPVRYIPNVGLVIEDEEEEVKLPSERTA